MGEKEEFLATSYELFLAHNIALVAHAPRIDVKSNAVRVLLVIWCASTYINTFRSCTVLDSYSTSHETLSDIERSICGTI